MLTAYLDESQDADRLLVIGGFVSESDKWVRFSAECEQIKDHFKIPFVHAAELFNLESIKTYGHLSARERSQVLGALLSAIRDHTEFSITSCVIPSEYHPLTTWEWRERHGTEYALVMTGIILGLWDHLCQSTRQEHTVSIFLEEGHVHAGEAEEVIRGYKKFTDDLDLPTIGFELIPNRLKISGYGRLEKAMAPPLWAADLVAYCSLNEIRNKDEFCAEIMSVIEETVPAYGVLLDDEKIKMIVNSSIEAESKRREWKQDTHNLVKYLFHEFGIYAEKHPRGVVLNASKMTPEQMKRFLEGK